MYVLFLSVADNANLSYEFSKCLKSVGIKSKCLSRKRPIFYKNGAEIYEKGSPDVVFKYAKKADIIVFMHSLYTYTGFESTYNRSKGAIVFHGGSAYRMNSAKINKEYRDLNIKTSLIQTLDLWNLPGANREIWLMPPVDTGFLDPAYINLQSKKKIIAHYPSEHTNAENFLVNLKGTEKINGLMNKLRHHKDVKRFFIYKTGPTVSYLENIERVSECDIYVECFRPFLQEHSHGEWGMSALEAAALGKVVVTNFKSHAKYEEEYGKHTIQVSNSLSELESNIKKIILMPNDKVLELQKDTRQWAVDQHSYEVVGKRLVDIFYKHLNWKGK